MSNEGNNYKIKILKNGPYLVTGNVPLYEKIITPKGAGYIYKPGREFPRLEEYRLCRCGKSKNMPYCDGSHERVGFIGTETASKAKYRDRARLIEGPGLDLLDDGRCAYARFCHSDLGDVWEMMEYTDSEEYRNKTIKAACDCPTGRLTAIDKEGYAYEHDYEPSIEILQDPEQESSAGLFVKGKIPIESADGEVYEIRNRAALCRCGKSRNKPFCDAMHISIGFSDKNETKR